MRGGIVRSPCLLTFARGIRYSPAAAEPRAFQNVDQRLVPGLHLDVRVPDESLGFFPVRPVAMVAVVGLVAEHAAPAVAGLLVVMVTVVGGEPVEGLLAENFAAVNAAGGAAHFGWKNKN